MDLVNFEEEIFDNIKSQFMEFSAKLDLPDVRFVPISALKGDNVVNRSEYTKWYNGPTLMYILENIYISSDINLIDTRFPVQYVIRPQSTEFHDYRGFAGRLASGTIRIGDSIKVLPSGFTSKVKSINIFDKKLEVAYSPQSIAITLEDEIDISRGDMIVREHNLPNIDQDIDLMICWLGNSPMTNNGKYFLKHTSSDVRCIIKEIVYKIDINTLDRNTEDKSFKMNDIGRIKIRTTKPIFFDSYRQNRITGSVILIDEATNNTVCAGMII